MLAPAATHRTTVHLRRSDVDLLGHVNQSLYHDFLADGRGDLPLAELLEAPRGLAAARVEVSHRGEVRFDDRQVQVVSRVEVAADGTSLVIEAQILKPDGATALESTTVLVPRAADARRPTLVHGVHPPLPPALGTGHTVQLRFSDLNPRARFKQSAYHAALEEGRSAAMTGVFKDWSGLFVVAGADTTHHAEVVLGDGELFIDTVVGHVGTSSYRLDSSLRVPDGTLVAECRTVLVGWDPEARGSRKLDERELDGLAAHRAESDARRVTA